MPEKETAGPRVGAAAPLDLVGSGWRLGRDMIVAPRRALVIYLAYLAVSVAFYSWKPADFPSVSDAPLALRSPLPQGPVFWAKVQAWSPALTAIWIYFLAWFVERLKTGRLAFWLFVSALVWVAPTVGLVLWASKQIPTLALGLVWLVALAPTVPLVRAKEPGSWAPLGALLLAIVAVNLALCPLFAVTVLIHSDKGYEGLEMVMLFWTLGLGTYLLSRIERLGAARAFAALFFSMIAQVAAVFSLHAGGLVSKEILKALMSI
ncbi:MAG: hypothetical protein NTX64_09120 [Elusimicrobia bacterium]|nr:hypothetical protein [Elusimicrobiota bacterium]